ncbi:MAG: hypothetical protein AAF988_03420 [Pseudomonadota bacterium]
MNKTLLKGQSPESEIMSEYIIYAYRTFDESQFGVNRWHRLRRIEAVDQAYEEAKSIHSTGQFQKVEIKRRWTDHASGAVLSKTEKIFEKRKWALPKDWRLWLESAGLGALGVAVFTIALL